MDSVQRTIAHALRDYRADAQRCLLGIAYALPGTGGGAARGPATSPLSLPAALALPDPGGWTGAVAFLLAGPSARRLEALGLDPGVLALVEVARLEQAGVGPDPGILRSYGAHGLAWARVRDAVSARGSAALTTRVAAQIERHGPRLTPALHRCLAALHDTLAAEGTGLVRHAAAHTHRDGILVSRVPAAVQGAPGWEIHLRIEPTVDGAWLMTARRTWAGSGPEPVAPAIVLTLHAGQGSDGRQIDRCMEEAFAIWYEDRSPGPAPRLSARRNSGP